MVVYLFTGTLSLTKKLLSLFYLQSKLRRCVLGRTFKNLSHCFGDHALVVKSGHIDIIFPCLCGVCVSLPEFRALV